VGVKSIQDFILKRTQLEEICRHFAMFIPNFSIRVKDSLAQQSGESLDPQRSLPKGIDFFQDMSNIVDISGEHHPRKTIKIETTGFLIFEFVLRVKNEI
jgi:hypothetical protein